MIYDFHFWPKQHWFVDLINHFGENWEQTGFRAVGRFTIPFQVNENVAGIEWGNRLRTVLRSIKSNGWSSDRLKAMMRGTMTFQNARTVYMFSTSHQNIHPRSQTGRRRKSQCCNPVIFDYRYFFCGPCNIISHIRSNIQGTLWNVGFSIICTY